LKILITIEKTKSKKARRKIFFFKRKGVRLDKRKKERKNEVSQASLKTRRLSLSFNHPIFHFLVALQQFFFSNFHIYVISISILFYFRSMGRNAGNLVDVRVAASNAAIIVVMIGRMLRVTIVRGTHGLEGRVGHAVRTCRGVA